MNVLVFGSPQLARWEARPFYDMTRHAGDRDDVYERDVGREPWRGAPGPLHRALGDAILGYDIFPPRLVRGVLRQRIAVGDTIGIHYIAARIVRLFFAARVVAVLDGPSADGAWWGTGFTYRTLQGHPELGEETFAVETELATGRVRVALRSWSRPGTWLARTFAPVVRWMQVHASEAALAHLARRAATAPRAGETVPAASLSSA